MAKKEKIQEQIQQIADRVKFLRTTLLAMISGFVWLAFSIGIDSIKSDFVSVSFLVVCAIGMSIVSVIIGIEETRRVGKIEELEKVE